MKYPALSKPPGQLYRSGGDQTWGGPQGKRTMIFSQHDRRLRVSTPLGPNTFMATRLTGVERISQLFSYTLELITDTHMPVEFDKLIGQPVGIQLDPVNAPTRYFHGICIRLTEGARDADVARYRLEIAPKFWLLTRRTQCRIFQEQTVPEILKVVLNGIDVDWDLRGTFHPRDFCVQYRESDFAFASRLMEEEGIYYYFAHDDKGHTMVVANAPQGHRDTPRVKKAIFDGTLGGFRDQPGVVRWE